MKNLAAALLLAALAAGADAAPLTPGTVFKTEEGGGVVIVDKDGRTEVYRMKRATRIIRDGKKETPENTLVGDVVIRGAYDPKTKVLTLLELKSGVLAAPAALPDQTVKGEVALTDAINGTLSVRVRKGVLREFIVADATKVLAAIDGKPAKEVLFETIAVGDPVEVRTTDGRTADEIRVRPGAR